ncbi:MAG: hypothetical protein ACREEP_11400 [Dongiaceae bacterium]
MGTRAIFTFRGGYSEDDSSYGSLFDRPVSVYKHWDGDPLSAAGFLARAQSNAWPAPRFECDEFAAAFVAANKQGCGDLRILPQDTPPRDYAHDAAYAYFVYPSFTGVLIVEAYEVDWRSSAASPVRDKLIYQGLLAEMAQAFAPGKAARPFDKED